MEENKEILELLKQIEKSNRRQARMGQLLCIFGLITALCCVVTFGMIYGLLPQIDAVIAQMQTVLGNLEQTTAQLAAVDFARMVSDVDTLVITGQQSLEQTMEKLNSVDFDALNQAIGDLAAVIEPLAKLSNILR